MLRTKAGLDAVGVSEKVLRQLGVLLVLLHGSREIEIRFTFEEYLLQQARLVLLSEAFAADPFQFEDLRPERDAIFRNRKNKTNTKLQHVIPQH